MLRRRSRAISRFLKKRQCRDTLPVGKKWAAEAVREMFGIPGCRALIRLNKEVRRDGKVLYEETRYFMSSLDPDKVSPAEFQAYILGHWEVESLHWHKDRYYREDKHVLGDAVGKTWTVLTNIAVSLARLLRKGERTLKEVRENCRLDPITPAETFGLMP